MLRSAVLVCVCNWIFQISNGLYVPKPGRSCIIGAGYSGLATARYMKENGLNFTVLEATKYIGGTWRFDPHVGTDEDGLPVFTSMYKDLRLNSPRETMEYRGFPFPNGTQSFPTGECFYKYLKLFTKEFGLHKHIQFRSWVNSVKWVNDHWQVTYSKIDTKEEHTEICDFVAVATGEFRVPHVPSFVNQQSFKGRIIHSHDYKEKESFKNRRVLIVGSGPSGLDIVRLLANHTAKLVHSHHRVFKETFFSNVYVKKPDIKEFNESEVVFMDDTFEELDDVILCTGYRYSYPFIDVTAGVLTDGKFIMPLYQHMVNILHPSMVFVGTPRLSSSSVREAQAEYAASLAAGKFKLPSTMTMFLSWMSEYQYLLAKNKTIEDINSLGDEMDAYFANLTMEAGIRRRPPVFTNIKNFIYEYRKENLLTFRDYDFEIVNDREFKMQYNPREGNPCPIQL